MFQKFINSKTTFLYIVTAYMTYFTLIAESCYSLFYGQFVLFLFFFLILFSDDLLDLLGHPSTCADRGGEINHHGVGHLHSVQPVHVDAFHT